MDAGLHDADTNDSGSMDASATPAERLQGLWQGICIGESLDDDGGTGESSRQGFAFSGDQFVSRIERYFDLGCVSPIVRLEISGTFAVGDAVASLNGAHDLDVTVSGLTAQLTNADFVDAANTEQFLGFDDWQANTARDVLGIDVFGTGHPLEQGSTIYQIFQIVPVSNGGIEIPVLLLGDESGGGLVLNPTQRPTALSQAPHAYVGPAIDN
jgi:hypothetical protein